MASTEMTRAPGQIKAINSAVRSAMVFRLLPALELAMLALIKGELDRSSL